MRARTATARRAITALLVAAGTLALPAPAALAGGQVVVGPTLDDSGSAHLTYSGGAYHLDAGLRVACPAASIEPCHITTRVRGFVHPAGRAPGVVLIASGSATFPAGTSRQVLATVNVAGRNELRAYGPTRSTVHIDATGGNDPSGGPFSNTAGFTGKQGLVLPARIKRNDSDSTSVSLAPGQRLAVRLSGASASAGADWQYDGTDAPGTGIISTRKIPDSTCAGLPGCGFVREFIIADTNGGTSQLRFGLYGPVGDAPPVDQYSLTMVARAQRPAQRVITFEEAGTTIHVRHGQEVVLKLDGENGSTGASWNASVPTTPLLRLASRVSYEDTCAPRTLGCPQHAELVYINRGAGSTRLRVRLVRGDGTVVRVFSATVVSG